MVFGGCHFGEAAGARDAGVQTLGLITRDHDLREAAAGERARGEQLPRGARIRRFHQSQA
jgi:hypothetical protein